MSKIIKPFENDAFRKARKFEKQVFAIEPEPPRSDCAANPGQQEHFVAAPDPEQLIADARLKAQELVTEARKEADDILRLAREEGFGEGIARGRKEADEKYEQRVRADADLLNSLIKELKAQESQVMRMLTPRLADLAMEIAGKVIHREIKINPLLVTAQAEEAVKKILERDRLIIRVNPNDEHIMKNHKAPLISMFDGIDKIEVIGDPAVEEGGCIVETHLVKVDAQPGSQLQAARKALGCESE